MTRPLDISGAAKRRRRRPTRREREIWAPRTSPLVDLTPRALRLDRSTRHRFKPRRRLDVGLMLIIVAALGLTVWLATQFWRSTRVEVQMTGLESGTPFTPASAQDLAISITLPKEDDRFRADLTLDGVELLEDLEFSGETIELRPAQLVEAQLVEDALDEGEHEITLTVDRMFLASSVFEWTYAVDSTAPALSVPAQHDPVDVTTSVTVRGEVEPGAELFLNGDALDHEDGRFEVSFEHPPTGVLRFEAIDRAGNASAATSVVPLAYPSRSRAVHVSAAAWGNDGLRDGVLSLVARGLIDTVELDLKDEDGIIGYASKVPMAQRAGAVREEFDLAEAVALLQDRDVRVIGRLVAFRDPVYARAAWEEGRRDEVLQAPDGSMLPAYGGFSNYVHPAVRQYNLDIALEAVDLGVTDILWDYVRRPEGSPETMVVPGLGEGGSAAAVVDFLASTHEALRARGAYQGASVFGIAAKAGDTIAQDVLAMATTVDYLAPMIYPSHWGPGQYGVARPIVEPFEITRRSLEHFQELTAGTGVHLLPWIQDFTLAGVRYGPAEVKAQIDAAASLGIEGFLLWNATVRYTADALSPIG